MDQWKNKGEKYRVFNQIKMTWNNNFSDCSKWKVDINDEKYEIP